MPAVSTNDLKNGMSLNLPEGLFSVVEFQHVKPGKGGAFVRTKLKNVRTGAVIERTYRADEKLDQALIDKREMQFLYLDGDAYVFMDTTDYEQLHAPEASLGTSARYLKEGDSAVLQMYDGEIVGVDLPAAVELTVTETEPGLQGDRVSGARKPATLETGLQMQVPLFVNTGRQGQGGHPQRGVPDPGRQLMSPSRAAGRSAREARERALSLLYEADTKACAPRRRARPTCPSPRTRSPSIAGRRGRAPSWTGSTLSSRPTPSAGRSTGCRPWTGLCCAWRRSSCWNAPTYRPRWRSPKRWSWLRSTRPTNRGASSTVCCRHRRRGATTCPESEGRRRSETARMTAHEP